MAIEHNEMVSTLNRLHCRTNFTIKNITEYMLPETKEAFYLHLDGKSPNLIIRPAFEVFSGELATLAGVHAKYDYFHNGEMTRFPKRLHKSLTETHYGLAFSFDSVEAVQQFITRLSAIVKGA
ncbi:hypothetical protein GCM10007984_10890 [Shewanella putrefaciens]|uniref:Uncharacterized protein n=4 Tax=Shewanella putrefaciens TaxID=24 RepID=E6XRZ0_SHEP2|nr:hypothetical protein SPWS13_1161 [Shewanella putrefaciens]MDR6963513.1 hypothetical protein [Shewanella putrefaciens]GGN14417.1 hypothetical protein GCM10007984_10890 [Shewanella putrefaciens]SUI60461.1 Uncharacterised protein [Shewanella putrefaciens]